MLIKQVALGLLAGLISLVLHHQGARADILVWDLVASCASSGKEIKLKMTRGDAHYAPADFGKAEKIFACGGSCKDTATLATPITWSEGKRTCACLPSGKPAASYEECGNEYFKCQVVQEASLPYACGSLAYNSICISPTCKDSGLDLSVGLEGAPCAELKPPSTALQCLAPVDPGTEGGDLSDEGGCSIGIARADLSVLVLFCLVGGVSLLRSRRRRPS